MIVLVTRPAADAAATAERIRALGHEPCLSPVSRLTATEAGAPPGDFDAVLATSANALRLAAPEVIAKITGKTLFTVGGHTAQAARARGLTRVISADGDQTALAALVRGAMPSGAQLLYLAGRERKPGLEAELSAADLRVVTAVIYESAREAGFTPQARSLLGSGQIGAVLHFSRAAAAGFIALARDAGCAPQLAGLSHHCMSADAAQPLHAAGLTKVRLAAHPDEAALLATLAP